MGLGHWCTPVALGISHVALFMGRAVRHLCLVWWAIGLGPRSSPMVLGNYQVVDYLGVGFHQLDMVLSFYSRELHVPIQGNRIPRSDICIIGSHLHGLVYAKNLGSSSGQTRSHAHGQIRRAPVIC